MEGVRELRRILENKKGKRDQVQKILTDIEEKRKEDFRTLHRCERALEIVKQVGLDTQKQFEYHISEQVSLALETVFDDPYEFKVRFEEKRGQTEVSLFFVRRNLEIPPMGNSGGGALDVASLALRIAYLSMRQDHNIRPILILDEPFHQLKGEQANIQALNLINELSLQLGIQVIMISDERVSREDIMDNADKVFYIYQQSGKSILKEFFHEEKVS